MSRGSVHLPQILALHREYGERINNPGGLKEQQIEILNDERNLTRQRPFGSRVEDLKPEPLERYLQLQAQIDAFDDKVRQLLISLFQKYGYANLPWTKTQEPAFCESYRLPLNGGYSILLYWLGTHPFDHSNVLVFSIAGTMDFPHTRTQCVKFLSTTLFSFKRKYTWKEYFPGSLAASYPPDSPAEDEESAAHMAKTPPEIRAAMQKLFRALGTRFHSSPAN